MNVYINDSNKVIFLTIDVQERLLPAIDNHVAVANNSKKLLKIANTLKIPIKVTEQYPKGLGHTVASLMDELTDIAIFEKNHFGCCGQDGFEDYLREEGRNQIVVFGIESHICVHTTVIELLERGYDVTVVADACGSRIRANHELAMANMLAHGANILPLESIAYQLLKKAGTKEFKSLLPLFK